LRAQSDSSFASESKTKSRYGYLFFCLGGLVCWTSAVSTRVLTSSTEAECHGLVQTGKENAWMRDFLRELDLFSQIPPTIVSQDNKSAISLSVGGVSQKRSKHFEIAFNKFREYIEQKEIEIVYKETDLLAADMFTKCLPPEKFKRHRDEIMGE